MSFSDSERFQKACERFDAMNCEDPRKEIVDGEEVPHEWIDAQRLANWVLKLNSEASESVQLAARCQHVKRWERPRSDYPEGRAGYLKWRSDLKVFHADIAEAVLRDVGYGDDIVDQVRRINLKKDLRGNADAQLMEDALCLVFLEFEFADFCERKEEDMMVRILQKTWKKMSESAKEAGLELKYNDHQRALLALALNPEG